jgi:Ran GTPase-activating protein (RanGAP) involved in mRNA processing and transport
MSSREISRGEQKYAEDYLKGKGDEPLWMQWVLKKKRDKIQDRLLIIGNYWVVSVKRNKVGKKSVQREGHLLKIKKLAVDENCKNAVIVFPEFHIECETPKIPEFMTVLRKALQKMSCGVPDHIPKIRGPDSCFPPLEPIEYGIAAGLFAIYEGWCNYFQCKPSPDFKRHVEDLVAAGNEELDLTHCPGIELKMEYTFQLEPILSALRYNRYFRTFAVRDVPRKEVLPLFATTLEANTYITRVILSGVESGPEGYQLIGDAFKKNPGNRLCEIDFSNNKMGEKGVAAFSSGIISLQHGISTLNLSNNQIMAKGIATLLAAIQNNSEVSATLSELDLSGNKFDQAGSQSFADWVSKLENDSNLTFLNLSNTAIDVSIVVNALKQGIVAETLTHLDISHNKIERSGAQALTSLLEASSCLTSLNVSECKLSGEAVEALLEAIAKNEKLEDTKIDISGNDLGSTAADNIAKSIAGNNQLHTLNLRDMKLKAEGLKTVIDAIRENSSIKCLDLGWNVKEGQPQLKEATKSLAALIKSHRALETLLLTGDGKNLYFGKALVKIFKAVAGNETLTELDISGNKIGDQAAIQLCEALRLNKGLTYLAWDGNGINMGGMQALRSCLANSNKTLADVPAPKSDIERAISASKDSSRIREKFSEVSAEILALVKQNKATNGDTHSNIKKAHTSRPPPTKPPTRKNDRSSPLGKSDEKEKTNKKGKEKTHTKDKLKKKDRKSLKKSKKAKNQSIDELSERSSSGGSMADNNAADGNNNQQPNSASSAVRMAPPPSLLSPPLSLSTPPTIRTTAPPTAVTATTSPRSDTQSGGGGGGGGGPGAKGTARPPVFSPPPGNPATATQARISKGAVPVFKPGGATLKSSPSSSSSSSSAVPTYHSPSLTNSSSNSGRGTQAEAQPQQHVQSGEEEPPVPPREEAAGDDESRSITRAMSSGGSGVHNPLAPAPPPAIAPPPVPPRTDGEDGNEDDDAPPPPPPEDDDVFNYG